MSEREQKPYNKSSFDGIEFNLFNPPICPKTGDPCICSNKGFLRFGRALLPWVNEKLKDSVKEKYFVLKAAEITNSVANIVDHLSEDAMNYSGIQEEIVRLEEEQEAFDKRTEKSIATTKETMILFERLDNSFRQKACLARQTKD